MTPTRINLTTQFEDIFFDNWKRSDAPGALAPTLYYQSMGWDLQYDAIKQLYSIPETQLTFFLLSL